MLGSSGVFFLLQFIQINTIFIGCGAIAITIALVLSFGLKEIYHAKSADPKQGFKTTFGQFWRQLKKQKSILLALSSNLACTSTLVCTYQYGVILFSEQYAPTEEAQSYCLGHISSMILYSQLMSIPTFIALGYLLDRVKIWKILLLAIVAIIAALVLFISHSKP